MSLSALWILKISLMFILTHFEYMAFTFNNCTSHCGVAVFVEAKNFLLHGCSVSILGNRLIYLHLRCLCPPLGSGAVSARGPESGQ